MNLAPSLSRFTKFLHKAGTRFRRLMPRQKSTTFGPFVDERHPFIGKVYIINLDRRPDRWAEMQQELRLVANSQDVTLEEMAIRYSAVDARNIAEHALECKEIDPYYTLADQLHVEPQPSAFPDRMELDRPITMTTQEIAVALSHVNVWRSIASSELEYGLVLEDDVWFRMNFARQMDKAWKELVGQRNGDEDVMFDLLYLSYKEVKNGALKSLISKSIFSPVRGLWYLSGYVLSRRGARRLLERLPCSGPVDLWINHQFGNLVVRAVNRPIIEQRVDGDSTNSYSVLSPLNRIGAINCEDASLFQIRPTETPVFVFGSSGTGMTSVAMALSLLGYRCCSDLENLPDEEQSRLMRGSDTRVFDAYVNIGSLKGKAQQLCKLFPRAKVIVTTEHGNDVENVVGGNPATPETVTVLRKNEASKWRIVCEHLRCAPPVCPFPNLPDAGERNIIAASLNLSRLPIAKPMIHDRSPWLIEQHWNWEGIRIVPQSHLNSVKGSIDRVQESLRNLEPACWFLRNDTFPGNLALFRPENVEILPSIGAKLSVRKDPLEVRNYSAAAISSSKQYLFGRFEAEIRASNVSGIVTGFFLHRDSPRQEIDIEIPGDRPDCLLVNVFYNPGHEDVRYDYGYRGSPCCIKLPFDASQSIHRFAIEWEPEEIRWFVDDILVHRRSQWDPTPIPHLPMMLHVNAWPTRSRELAGKLKTHRLPTSVIVKSIELDAYPSRATVTSGPQIESLSVNESEEKEPNKALQTTATSRRV